MIISEHIFFDISKEFDFYGLIDSQPINLNSWESIASQYDFDDIALILAPGVDSEYEFEGSGFYKIDV